MSNRIPNYVFLILSFAVTVALYWPSMNGTPVWDDTTYLFKHPTIVFDYSYWKILTDFSWPVSVSIQKILYNLFKTNYLYYHLVNVALHYLNSWLLLKVAQTLKLPFARLLFLFFLLHPSNVITVSWIIQFKTLLCFTFALLSFLYLIRAQEKKSWYVLSLFCFALSIFSKSPAIPLPAIFLFYLWRNTNKKNLLWLIPFFLLSAFGSYRVLNSTVTKIAVDLQTGPIAAEPSSEYTDEKKIYYPTVTPVPGSKTKQTMLPIMGTSRFESVMRTIYYYFWQTLLPVRNEPVKGQYYADNDFKEYLHIIFLILVVYLNWKSSIPFLLLAGYVMTSPFMGLLPAPFMNVTWVSDQHLYLAMPFFICFWLTLITRWKFKIAPYLPYAFIPAYCFLVFTTSHYYKNEIAFFKSSLEADVLNVPIGYNLAIAHLHKGDINEALNVTSTFVHMADVAPEVMKNKYFPYMMMLHFELEGNQGKKK